MSSTLKGVREERYPLHALVWHNQHPELERQLQRSVHNLEALDPLGRTPLHLAVSLDHRESVWVLLRHGADVSHENRHGWSVLQEAVSTRDIELLQHVLHYRDFQRMSRRLAGIPELMKTLRKVQCYVQKFISDAVLDYYQD
uniref:ankyrin repeat domain-containing protein 13B-like n=1 Tax=Myxine glutinosa TaxID=7769 RepID=UPI00358FC5A3